MNNTNKIFHRVLFMLLAWSLIALSPKIIYSQEMIQKPVLEFAQKSLEGYVNNVLSEKNFAKFNFKTLGEAKMARLGTPYKVMYIGLSPLKAYKAGTGLRPILTDAKTLWFPVMVEGKVRTKLEIVEKEGKWIAGEFGGIRVVREIAIVRDQVPSLLESKGLREPYEVILVKIPALYAVFFYVESSRGEYLIPAMAQPQRYKLQNGKMYAADEVLSKLRDIAKEIDEKKVL